MKYKCLGFASRESTEDGERNRRNKTGHKLITAETRCLEVHYVILSTVICLTFFIRGEKKKNPMQCSDSQKMGLCPPLIVII